MNYISGLPHKGNLKEIKADKRIELENHIFRTQNNMSQGYDLIGIKNIH